MSPDERFIARATSTYGPRLPGGSESHYDFVVEDCAGTRIQHIKIPMARDDLINWRLDGSIAWAVDSSAVSFGFKGARLTLLMDREQ
jgi:hypothetical protein